MNSETKNSVNEWENISHHLKTVSSAAILRAEPSTEQAFQMNQSMKEHIRKSFFPTYDLPSVPRGKVLLTQESNWVGASRTMNLSPSENHAPAWPSDTHRHLMVGFHSVAFISLNYAQPCPVGYKVFPFYRWENWGLEDKGWLLARDGSTRTHNWCSLPQEFLSFFYLFFSNYKNNICLLWKIQTFQK